LTKGLEDHVFVYGTKNSADQMNQTLKKIIEFIGTKYNTDITSELTNRKPVEIKLPPYTPEQLARHQEKERHEKAKHERLIKSIEKQIELLEAQTTGDSPDPDVFAKIAQLENDLADEERAMAMPIPITLVGDEKLEREAAIKRMNQRISDLNTYQGNAFSIIKGNCSEALIEKMKNDKDWEAVSQSFNPLQLLELMERAVLSQQEDEYPFAVVYEQEVGLLGFQQNN